MNELRDKAGTFADEVRQWVGNSPLKAGTFGGVCAGIGYLSSIWPF